MVIVCLYVDDMLIVGTNVIVINETKEYLSSVFKMKDLGEVDTILGIKVRKHSGGYVLSQSHYIKMILTKFNHLEIKEMNSPFDNEIKLKKILVEQLQSWSTQVLLVALCMLCIARDQIFPLLLENLVDTQVVQVVITGKL